MIEVHDCFSITELVTMEDLDISEAGDGWKDVLDGFYDADGKVPCQIDGGLKCFGHPIGASGLRMLYEIYLQLQGRAGARQLKEPKIGIDPQSRRRPARERVQRGHRRPLRVTLARARCRRRRRCHPEGEARGTFQATGKVPRYARDDNA